MREQSEPERRGFFISGSCTALWWLTFRMGIDVLFINLEGKYSALRDCVSYWALIASTVLSASCTFLPLTFCNPSISYIIPILQIRKLSLRAVRSLDQDYASFLSIYSLDKYSLSTCCVPRSILRDVHTLVRKTKVRTLGVCFEVWGDREETVDVHD